LYAYDITVIAISFSSIVFAASDIFRKGTSWMSNAKLGIKDAFQKIFLYVHGI